MTASKLLILVSVIVFVLDAFGVHPQLLADVELVPIGLALFASSFLVP